MRRALSLLLFLLLAELAVGQILTSPPVGVLRAEIPANSRTLLAAPFLPLAQGIQPSAPAERPAIDLLVWSSDTQAYATPDSPKGLLLGDGGWVSNNAPSPTSVFLCGRVPMVGKVDKAIHPRLNLLGSPFSGPVTLGGDGDEEPILYDASNRRRAGWAPLAVGEGCWIDHEGPARNEMLVRPYVNPFHADESLLSALDVAADETGVQLGFRGTASKGGYSLLAQDADPAVGFRPLLPVWEVLRRGLRPDASGQIWLRDPQPLPSGQLRFYILVEDNDSDADGIPDAEELFVQGSDPYDVSPPRVDDEGRAYLETYLKQIRDLEEKRIERNRGKLLSAPDHPEPQSGIRIQLKTTNEVEQRSN